MTWWRRLCRRGTADREFQDEIETHIAEAADYYVSQGMPPDRARRLARLRFGNPRAHREQVNDMNRLPLFDVLGRDVRIAVRRLRQAPGFSAGVILTLALVVGATSAVFSLADRLLLAPLPVPQPERLMVVGYKRVTPTGTYVAPAVDGAMFAAVRDRARTIDTANGSFGTTGVNFVSGQTPSFAQNQLVGDGFFRVIGVAPHIGREFEPAEAAPGGPAVAILSFSFWQRVFQGHADALGQTILLRGEPYTVVGVMPDTLKGFLDADVWTPLRSIGQGLNYQAVARLKDNVTADQANAELATLGDEPFRMQRPPAAGVTRSLELLPLHDVTSASAREPIVMLGWAVSAVLLIACVNIAALLLARGGSRTKEIATRMALGSGRAAVVRQLMIESVVLALIGGALGVLIASGTLEALKSLGGSTFSDWQRVTLNARTVAVTLGLSALTSVVFGLLPAWQTSRIDVSQALVTGGSRSIAGGSQHIARRLLVVAEVALGVVMLVAAGLLLRQFASLQRLDPGFSATSLYTVSASLQDARYREPASVTRLFDDSLERLRRTPGIDAVAVSQRLPYERLLNMPFAIEGRPIENDRVPLASVAYITPSFFETFSIPITAGRTIEDRDTAAMPKVVVVNETFTRLYFPGERAVGRRLVFNDATIEIAGVSRDVQQSGTGFFLTGMRRGPITTSPTVYFPAAQADPGMFRWFPPTWTVRASSASVAAEAFARSINAADPLLPLEPVRSMSEVVGRSLATPRLMMTLVGVLAAAALILAAIGIHGLITQVVSERTREFGIRLALGAPAGRLVRDVAVSGVVLAGIGAAAGAALSLPATKLVEAFLTELTRRDATTYVGVALVLFAVAVVASVLPALRVVRLDPSRTLRQ